MTIPLAIRIYQTWLHWSAAPTCASIIDSLLGLIGILVAVGDVDGCGSQVTKCLYNDPSSDLINSNVFFFRKRFLALNQLRSLRKRHIYVF